MWSWSNHGCGKNSLLSLYNKGQILRFKVYVDVSWIKGEDPATFVELQNLDSQLPHWTPAFNVTLLVVYFLPHVSGLLLHRPSGLTGALNFAFTHILWLCLLFCFTTHEGKTSRLQAPFWVKDQTIVVNGRSIPIFSIYISFIPLYTFMVIVQPLHYLHQFIPVWPRAQLLRIIYV